MCVNQGYLRLGKIARLQKKREFAWKLYDAGIQANKGSPASSSKKLQVSQAAKNKADC